MKVFSMFTGIGGFDLAARNKCHEIVGACEIDEFARQIYAKHFPQVPIHSDATKLEPDALPDFDLIAAGFPCQAFSIAGERKGFDDTRGTLFFEIARVARAKRPRYLLLENVTGLLNHDEGQTARTIARALDEIGYDTEWRVIDTADFLPQHRERVFIIGYNREKTGSKVLPLKENNRTAPKIGQKKKRLGNETHPTLLASYFKMQNSDTYIVESTVKVLNYGPPDDRETQTERVYDESGLAPTLCSSHASVLIKDGPLDSNNILTNNSADDLLGVIRKLTPLECERLQEFPEGWTEGIPDAQRYKCLGNAVTVTVIEHILDQL